MLQREEIHSIVNIASARGHVTEPQPVFVLGSMRSGASLLALSLSQHSTIAPVQDTVWLERFAMGLQQTYLDATSNTPFPKFGSTGVDQTSFFAHFGDAVSRMIAGDGASTHWLDSTYTHAFIAAPLARLFPHGRFIHVLRDVDGVVGSLTSAENRKSYRSQHRQLSVRDAYEHWLDVVTACVEAERCLGSNVVLRIRRDDLVREPERMLRRCMDFLGEPFEHACLRPFAGFDQELPRLQAPDVDEPWRTQVDIFSRTLLDETEPNYRGDDAWRARLETAFLKRCTTAPVPETN